MASAGELLLLAAAAVPPAHYLVALIVFVVAFLYDFLEFHFLRDLVRGLRGDAVVLTYGSSCELYHDVVSKCRILHGRYLPTPWLSSPHFQTTFLNFFGRPPVVRYRRQLFSVRDGGTIALDWILASDAKGYSLHTDGGISKDDTTPIMVVVPGLTSDSASAYIKHLAHTVAKQGWHVVVSNHRGLGGVSITSDCLYNAGWTEDLREVVNYLNHEHPKAPLFAVGTSIGANILVKYLGEEGESTPVAGAVSVCSPWDLVVCDRFINRKLVQRLYDRALAIGLQGYAKQHQPLLTRLANWEGIQKSRTVRGFDHHATRIVANFETVDTYYRHCSSAQFVGNVSVPLLCLSALDDPVCTREAIPWDECRANHNIVLATTAHGGHLGFFQGITASKLWWVGAVAEFLAILHSSSLTHKPRKTQDLAPHSSLQSSIDKSPYISLADDGMVVAAQNDEVDTDKPPPESTQHHPGQNSQDNSSTESLKDDEITTRLKRSINQLSRQSNKSMWLLAYIAIISTCPLVGSLILIIFRRKLKNVLPASWFTGR
ncbi:Alcohol O-acetyltransferase protein [Dioscorea alata]|uniref:Alcohol O-acetyltransferase protein n=1 Tax=Dioscorea alata TaxID=55571 RepID=A0ACB7WBS0_DIOAL|nr:Alcohol O-acetyltransferase protein [Dioscorea alata]